MRGSSLDREAVEAEIDRVRSLGFDELRALWRRTFRSSPPSAFTKDLVARFICWHLQEQDIKSMRSSHPCSRISHCRALFAGYGFRDLPPILGRGSSWRTLEMTRLVRNERRTADRRTHRPSKFCS
jgi:hypothetical protein